jgi:hypothetical protein
VALGSGFLASVEASHEGNGALAQERVGRADVLLDLQQAPPGDQGAEGALVLEEQRARVAVVRLDAQREGVGRVVAGGEHQAQAVELRVAAEDLGLLGEAEHPLAQERAAVPERPRVDEAAHRHGLAGEHLDPAALGGLLRHGTDAAREVLLRETAELFPELDTVGQNATSETAPGCATGFESTGPAGVTAKLDQGGSPASVHLVVEPLDGARIRGERRVVQLAKVGNRALLVVHGLSTRGSPAPTCLLDYQAVFPSVGARPGTPPAMGPGLSIPFSCSWGGP